MNDMIFPEMFKFNDLVDFAEQIGATPSLVDLAEDFEPSISDFEEGEIFDDYVVYIRDFESEQDRRFHICCCATIFNFIKYGTYDVKYKSIKTAAISLDRNKHIFPVYFTNTKEEDRKELKVCKNCLWTVNYRNYRNETESRRNKIYEKFSIVDFLEEYKINIPSAGDWNDGLFNVYSDDWGKISRYMREKANWKCELCGTDYSQDKQKLHVHHANSNKRDNRPPNLRVLCHSCHMKVHHFKN